MSAIPADALEAAHWLIAGTTGSGKTYLARGQAEQLRRAGRRIGIVDKMAKLWGLTVSADGSGQGLEFVIFGGKRPGAVPMRPQDGDRLGRLFVERNVPAIFDLSRWDADEQQEWVAAFSRAVFQVNETALHLLMDEAQSWVPANGGGEAYKAVRLLAEQGRGNGINLLLTAPRLNGIDVNVRQALGGMVAMKQTSIRDQVAVAELIGGHVSIDEKALRAELGTLPTGTGFVWSPTDAGIERVAFAANSTFDSSRTPRHGDAPPPPIAVSSALVDELRKALAPPAPASDPSIPANPAEAYKLGTAAGEVLIERDRRIAELEGELAHETQRCGELEQLLRRHRRIVAEAHGALGKLFVEEGEQLRHLRPDEAPAVVAEAAGGESSSRVPPAHARQEGSSAGAAPQTGAGGGAAGAASAPPGPAAVKRRETSAEEARLSPSARKLLLQIAVLHPRRVTLDQAQLAAGLSKWSSTFQQNRKTLIDGGWIIVAADKRVDLSPRAKSDSEIGSAIAQDGGDPVPLWASRFSPGVGRMLTFIADGWRKYQRAIDQEELAEGSGMSITSSTFKGGITELRRNGLIENHPSGFILAEALRSNGGKR